MYLWNSDLEQRCDAGDLAAFANRVHLSLGRRPSESGDEDAAFFQGAGAVVVENGDVVLVAVDDDLGGQGGPPLFGVLELRVQARDDWLALEVERVLGGDHVHLLKLVVEALAMDHELTLGVYEVVVRVHDVPGAVGRAQTYHVRFAPWAGERLGGASEDVTELSRRELTARAVDAGVVAVP